MAPVSSRDGSSLLAVIAAMSGPEMGAPPFFGG